MAQYFLKRGDAVHGPFSVSQVIQGAAEGKIRPDDQIGHTVDGPWKTAQNIEQLSFSQSPQRSAIVSQPPPTKSPALPHSTSEAVLPPKLAEFHAHETPGPITGNDYLESWGAPRIAHFSGALLLLGGIFFLLLAASKTYSTIGQILTFKIDRFSTPESISESWSNIATEHLVLGLVLLFAGLTLQCISFGLPSINQCFSRRGRQLNCLLAITLFMGAALYFYGNYLLSSYLRDPQGIDVSDPSEILRTVNAGNRYVLFGTFVFLVGGVLSLGSAFVGYEPGRQHQKLRRTFQLSVRVGGLVAILGVSGCVFGALSDISLLRVIHPVVMDHDVSPSVLADGMLYQLFFRTLLIVCIATIGAITFFGGRLALSAEDPNGGGRTSRSTADVDRVHLESIEGAARYIGLGSLLVGPIVCSAIGWLFWQINPGLLLELRGSNHLTAFLLVGMGVHLALGLTAIALGQPCLSYKKWRGAKMPRDNPARTGTRLGLLSVMVFSILLVIGHVDLARRKKRSITPPAIPTVQSFADFSRVMLAGQVSDDAGISVDFSPSEAVNLDPKEVTALQFDDGNEEEFFLTDAGLVYLKRYPNLKHLNLRGAIRITDNGLKQLARVPRLTLLNIDDTVITDEGLKYVGRLGELEVLIIGVVRAGPSTFTITDRGLVHLESLENLTYLSINGENGITPPGVARLQAVLEDCTIQE